jgi:hypothetical protein
VTEGAKGNSLYVLGLKTSVLPSSIWHSLCHKEEEERRRVILCYYRGGGKE